MNQKVTMMSLGSGVPVLVLHLVSAYFGKVSVWHFVLLTSRVREVFQHNINEAVTKEKKNAVP